LPSATAVNQVITTLTDHEIETRWWWPYGVADMPAFASATREPLTVSQDLGERILGLPFGTHLTAEDLEILQGRLSMLRE